MHVWVYRHYSIAEIVESKIRYSANESKVFIITPEVYLNETMTNQSVTPTKGSHFLKRQIKYIRFFCEFKAHGLPRGYNFVSWFFKGKVSHQFTKFLVLERYLVREFRMSYLLSWSIYLWDLLEGVCVEKNALKAEVSYWTWYQQLFTQRRTLKEKMSPLRIERTRRVKVSAGMYYRQLFAKKENLQYKEMIEISRWSLDRGHPYGLWFIYWDPPKIQTSYTKRTGGNTRLSNEILKFLSPWSTQNCFTRGHISETSNTVTNLSKGKKKPHTIFHLSFPMIFCGRIGFFRILRNLFGKKKWSRSVALVTRYDVISSMKSIYF